MRHLKTFKLFENIKLIDPPDSIERIFKMPPDVVEHLLFEITDNFDNIIVYVDDAESSDIVKPDNENIFVIYVEDSEKIEDVTEVADFFDGRLKKEMNSQLSPYGLEIYTAEIGEDDWRFEIVICKKEYVKKIEETEFEKRRHRFSVSDLKYNNITTTSRK
jgi:hypothetical protein